MNATKRVLGYALLLALLCFPVWVYLNAQALTDWAQLRGYTPPIAVKTLADQDTMTTYARHVFYVNHPDLENNAAQFRTDCSESEQTIVLGCYRPNQRGIFVYNVQDKRLAGVQQVTAAHEMLHAAYDRLSSKDKKNIDSQLMDYYNHDLKDQRIIDTINAYKQTEPNDLVNEMHSIFGTEIADLPTPLQTYYAKYFANRQAITTYASAYENEFTTREQQVKADDAKLAELKVQIQTQEDSLQSQSAKIDSDRSRLDSERASGDISSYNAGVAPFNREVQAYNSGVQRLHRDISTYNQLVVERNAIAQELTSLASAIDTRLTPQTAQ
jgi:hypothetical protein